MAFEPRMSRFQPTRVSPPARPIRAADSDLQDKHIADIPESSIPELSNISPEDVELLDAVMKRAGPSATSFLNVYKAYNDLRNELGLDPRDEIIYKKLLKLGTVKETDWRDKWNAVKSKYGYRNKQVKLPRNATDNKRKPTPSLPTRRFVKQSASITRTRTGYSRTPDSRELVSRVSDLESDEPQYHNTPHFVPRQSLSPSPSETLNPQNGFAMPSHARLKSYSQPISDVNSIATDEYGAPSSTPPSYRTVAKEVPIVQSRVSAAPQVTKQLLKPTTPLDVDSARRAVAQARERRGSVSNRDETWKKIKMEQAEKTAEQYYQEKLIERCWEVWKSVFEWGIVTCRQIDEARDNLCLRINLQRWQKALASRRKKYQDAIEILDRSFLKRSFAMWVLRLKSKQQENWRRAMRMGMKKMKERRELLLKRRSWTEWRSSFHYQLAVQRYDDLLLITFFKRWQDKFMLLDRLSLLLQKARKKQLARTWAKWNRGLELRLIERRLIERMNSQIMNNALKNWWKQIKYLQKADVFYDWTLMRRSFESWKTSRDRINILEAEILKYPNLQKKFLLRRFIRIWKAEEAGKLLERVVRIKCMNSAWSIWQERLERQQFNQRVAHLHATRNNNNLLTNAFEVWLQRWVTYRKLRLFAKQYRAKSVQHHVFLHWHTAARGWEEIAKLAPNLNSTFTQRLFFKKWRIDMVLRQKELLLKRRRLKRIFFEWVRQAHQDRSVKYIQKKLAQDMVINALSRWTRAVVKVKIRELEFVEQQEQVMQKAVFTQWKALFIRHLDALSLLESHLFVQTDECLRRTFHRWFTTAQITHHRRISLQKKEDKLKLIQAAKVWDNWRSRFVEQKLHAKETEFVEVIRLKLLFCMFRAWCSKTKPLLALRFHTTCLKKRHFGIWKLRLLQFQVAREKHRSTLLVRHMNKWVETCRARIALRKAARSRSRGRYLEQLPSAIPRLSDSVASRGASKPPSLYEIRDDASEDKVDSSISLLSKAADNKATIASIMNLRRFKKGSPPASSTDSRGREVSPVRSIKSVSTRDGNGASSSKRPSMLGNGEGRRSRLWAELQEVRRKSKRSQAGDLA
ncbi:hypothetical protein AMATHDRAFT_170288 [Amanita thiersii Skay4041]|uniref:Sfi1 spindle body domain-containing protein n=1 Tax=Amanita thiersii Skay4041 TaxID=703135 RepID=A0A2A9P1B8_9AGAR|nr:hypothetical protein AMATHDRAFT_170288 [Amanita thiersii Skay4041]